MDDCRNIKKSSKEKNSKNKERKHIYNKLLINNNKEKYLYNNNIRNNTTNLKTESINLKKDYKSKLNRINIKSFIKKIDLFSLSLTKRANKTQRKKYKKDKIANNNKNLNKHFIKLKFDEPKKEKKFDKITYIRKHSKNFDKIFSNKNVNNTYGNIVEQKYKNENILINF